MSEDSAEQRLAESVGRGMYERDRAALSLGIELVDIGPGRARMRMEVRGDMLNSHGACHGGLVFTLADCAFAYACNARNEATVALSCAISFTSAARQGEALTAIAEERHRQGRTGVYDISVSGQDGRTVAMFRGNSYRVRGAAVPDLGDPAGPGPG